MASQITAIVCLVLASCSLVPALYMFYGMLKNNTVKVLGGLIATMGIWTVLYLTISVMALLQQHGRL